jgi:alpha,alpha-trehalase
MIVEPHKLLTGFRTLCRFGWVNASYVYGLQIINAHMRRALGTLTPYPTFIKAIEMNNEKALAGLA